MISKNISLKSFNTLNIDAKAHYFAEISDMDQLKFALAFSSREKLPLWIIGGGSNIVIREDLEGLVLHIALKGIQVLDEGRSSLVIASAGEVWDELVEFCLHRGLFGLENLSIIPGSVGAAPIQNIGAYGTEVAQTIEWVEFWDIKNSSLRKLSAKQCEFAYRDSIFKGYLKGAVVITQVAFRLQKQFQVNLAYSGLREAVQELVRDSEAKQKTEIDAALIRQVVCQMRRSKLPDPAVLPNVGSFFKNPIISAANCQQLLQRFPEIPLYNQADGSKKVAAGWLIEQAGWKGKDFGSVGVHALQALVLVNKGGGSGIELLQLADKIQCSVKQLFNIALEIEPQIIP